MYINRATCRLFYYLLLLVINIIVASTSYDHFFLRVQIAGDIVMRNLILHRVTFQSKKTSHKKRSRYKNYTCKNYTCKL